VAALLRDWGATVIDADAIVRDLQRPGTAVFRDISAHFGPGVVGPDGALDRAALRARVLAHPDQRKVLEKMVHPAVEAERRRLLANAAASASQVVCERHSAAVRGNGPVPIRRRGAGGRPGAAAAGTAHRHARAQARRGRGAHAGPDAGGGKAGARHLRDRQRRHPGPAPERAWLVWRKLLSRARARA
jgi:hypothetical protein